MNINLKLIAFLFSTDIFLLGVAHAEDAITQGNINGYSATTAVPADQVSSLKSVTAKCGHSGKNGQPGKDGKNGQGGKGGKAGKGGAAGKGDAGVPCTN
ncbi:hypothetical protein [Klebsiella variicola]|uniref:hypothetical protein n=1 Tax=Klebsiella variicola TaxID=244366 RepID=UPI00188FD5B8|nr:hypothetical protein [Klebsiella variicola]